MEEFSDTFKNSTVISKQDLSARIRPALLKRVLAICYFVTSLIQSEIIFNAMGEIVCSIFAYSFGEPVSAFGFDHLSQSADGYSFTSIQVFDPSNVLLFSGTVPISNIGGMGGGAPGG